jgi:hypothetical protein
MRRRRARLKRTWRGFSNRSGAETESHERGAVPAAPSAIPRITRSKFKPKARVRGAMRGQRNGLRAFSSYLPDPMFVTSSTSVHCEQLHGTSGRPMPVLPGGGRKENNDALDNIRGPSSTLACGHGELVHVWRTHLPAARGRAGGTADPADHRAQTCGLREHSSQASGQGVHPSVIDPGEGLIGGGRYG